MPLLIGAIFSSLSSTEIKTLDSKIEELDEKLSENKESILKKIDEYLGVVEDNYEEFELHAIYTVHRTVPLNFARRFNGPAIRLLMPGEEVELIERHGKWIKVRLYDVTTDQVLEGWVLKKYLILLS